MTTPRLMLASTLLSLAALPSLSAQATPAAKNPNGSEEVLQMSAYTVQESRRHEYRATNSISATRINLPLSEVPLSMQVITADFLGDIGVFDSREGLQWLASMDGRNVRGFNTGDVLRNGFSFRGESSGYTIERTEIIKGPSAILDAVTSPGGITNVITKTAAPGLDHLSVRLNYGSTGDRWQANVDVAGRAGSQKEWGDWLNYRLVGVYENIGQGPLTKWGTREMTDIVPSLLLRPTRNTTIAVEYQKYDLKGGGESDEAQGRTLTVANVPLAIRDGIDPNTSWMGPDQSFEEGSSALFVSVEQRVTPDLTVQVAGNRFTRSGPWLFQPLVAIANNTATGGPSIRRQWRRRVRDWEYNQWMANFAYKFKMGAAEHRLVGGYLNKDNSDIQATWQARNVSSGAALTQFFAITDPAPDLRVPAFNTFYWLQDRERLTEDEVTSMFLNHHGRFFGDRLFTLLGVYKLKLETSSLRRIEVGPTPALDSADEVLPQIGAVWKLREGLAIYANHSKSLVPNVFDRDGFNNPFDPTEGESLEFGAKFELFGGKLLGSAAVYRIDEVGRIAFDPLAPNLDTDPTNPNSPRGANVQFGEVRAEGFDVELNYYPMPNWSFIAGYAFNDSVITVDPTPANVGNPVTGLARHKATIWNKYTFSSGRLKGLLLGGGIQWRGEKVRTIRNGAPAYEDPTLRLDLLAGYTWRAGDQRYRVTLNAKNLARSELIAGFKPGTNDGYYFKTDPELVLSCEVTF